MSLSPASTTLLEIQSQQITMITQMMARMFQRESTPLPSQYAKPGNNSLTSRLKHRSEGIVDLTSPDTNQAGGNSFRQEHVDSTKEQDTKETPSGKEIARDTGQQDISHGIHLPDVLHPIGCIPERPPSATSHCDLSMS
jgi:hypothetical protein